MKLNVKKFILTFFILIVTFVIGAEQKTPNVIILENPQKEVTTVEGLKNRESAEMNIKVKKRNIEEIDGIETKDGIEFILPKEHLLKGEEIKVVKSLVNLPLENSGNSRRKRSLFNVEIPSTVVDKDKEKIVRIAKEEAENTNYILAIDRNSNDVNRIYRGRTVRSTRGSWNQGLIRENRRLGAVGWNDNSLIRDTWSRTIRIAYDYWWITKVAGGWERDKIVVPKNGDNSESIDLYFKRYIIWQSSGQVAGQPDAYDLGKEGYLRKRADGGFIGKFLWGSRMRGNSGSDIDVEMTFEVPATQPNYRNKGGIFISNGIGNISMSGKYNDIGGWFNHGAKAPGDILLLATRYPINVTINMNSTMASLESSGLKNLLGYTSYSNQYTVTDLDSSGITLDHKGINIPSTLSSGTYRINVVWDVGIPGLNSNINGSGDVITINYTNPREKNIGEVEFHVDKRLRQLNASWIDANGNLGQYIGSSGTRYDRLVKLTGEFTNLVATTITDVVSIEGRGTKLHYESYKVFTIASGNWQDESAMPFNIQLNTLRDHLKISKNNSNNSDLLNNRFTLKGADGTYYKGNVKEVYDGEDAAEAVGTLNLSKLGTGAWVVWNRPGGTGSISSTDGDGNITMELSSGKLFNWNSATSGSRIVTKLKVTDSTGKVEELTSGDLRTTTFVKNTLGINNNGFYIHKNDESTAPETYKIEIYYQDILLGKLELTVTNKQAFEIVGGDVINLGKIIQGDSRKMDGSLRIKNLNSKKILSVELNDKKPIKVMHVTNKDVELPITGEVHTSGQGIEVPVLISLTANAAENQLIGDYEGELNLYITIE